MLRQYIHFLQDKFVDKLLVLKIKKNLVTKEYNGKHAKLIENENYNSESHVEVKQHNYFPYFGKHWTSVVAFLHGVNHIIHNENQPGGVSQVSSTAESKFQRKTNKQKQTLTSDCVHCFFVMSLTLY